MEVVKYMIQAAIAFFEIWLCYQMLYFIVIEKQYLTRKEKGIEVFNIIVLGIMLAVNRNLAFFSHIMFWVCVLITVICAWLIKRKELLMIVGIVTLYYSCVSLADFFFAFGTITFLKEEFYQAVLVDSNSLWEESIFLCSRVSIAVGMYFLKKKKEIRESFIESRSLILIVSVILCIVLRRYQLKLCGMAIGEVIMNGATAGISLVAIVSIVIFVTSIILNSVKIQKENSFLRLVEKMSEQYYYEAAELLEENHQLVHDIKNHFIVIKRYAEEEENSELCKYIDEISSELFGNNVNDWSGNKVLDFVLNQKRHIAECEKIDFEMEVDVLLKLPLRDSEICSLFGNLLDNAIEACKSMRTRKKWIKVKVKRKNDLMFIEVSNSIEKEPLIKNGRLISSKGDNSKHGYGLRNIERIVKKYDGTISYQIEKNRFQICVTFFDMEVPL